MWHYIYIFFQGQNRDRFGGASHRPPHPYPFSSAAFPSSPSGHPFPFPPVSSMASMVSPAASSQHPLGWTKLHQTARRPNRLDLPPDESANLEELEAFSKMFKQKRIKLGYTQVKIIFV